jgi:predicted TIM-barrel fold metal-dependent hydrolase
MGANWVPWLIQSFRRAYGISPKEFAEDPVETFRRHVWISPFHEDDVAGLKALLGADRLLMGSDWPHAEGLAEPSDYVRELGAFTPAEQKLVMHDNAAGLVKRV